MNKEEEKKKFLFDLKQEIEDLKSQLNPSAKETAKRKIIINAKISLKILNKILPFVVAATISVGGIKLLGAGYPFIIDDEKKYLVTRQTIDENGDTVYHTEQYLSSYSGNVHVNYYSQWEYNGEEYRRTLEEYKTSKFSPEEILAYFNTYKEISSLLGKTDKYVYERSLEKPNEIEEEIEITSSQVNQDEYIISPESKSSNIASTVMTCLLTAIFEVLAFGLTIGKDNLRESIEAIKEKYNYNIKLSEYEIETLVKFIEIKENNYRTLTRRLNDGK